MSAEANHDAGSQINCVLNKLKILIVEDSESMRGLLTALLRTMGVHQIFCAEDGDAGLKLFIEHQPDLVITDGAMKPTSGYAMTSAIRALRTCDGSPAREADVPVLMLSGHDEPQKIEQARDNGVSDYIVKPVTAELLYERVIAAVSNSIHLIETPTYRGLSPRRRLVVHDAFGDTRNKI